MRCPTCHNAELAWWPERIFPLARRATKTRLTASLPWLDGLVVTGGEPTEAPGLLNFLADLKTLGLPIKLDTNGLAPDLVAQSLYNGLADAISVDVKGPFDMYPELTGGRCTAAEASDCLTKIFKLAAAYPKTFTFRQTRVPTLTDQDVEHTRILLPQGFELKIQTYRLPRNLLCLH
ncbi:hypothetical protein DSUL_210002 [Desulfovibrionales bacterium]